MRWGTSSQTHLLSPVLKIKVITSLVTPLENFPTTMESLIVLKYPCPTMCQNLTKNLDTMQLGLGSLPLCEALPM
jgi:hypothetical protein